MKKNPIMIPNRKTLVWKTYKKKTSSLYRMESVSYEGLTYTVTQLHAQAVAKQIMKLLRENKEQEKAIICNCLSRPTNCQE